MKIQGVFTIARHFLILTSLLLIVLSACDARGASEKLIDEFNVYKEANHLDVLQQTVPQRHDNVILAFYETADEKFGVIEFDNDRNAKVEKDLEDITVNPLKGKHANYVGIRHSLERIPDARKVNLYSENKLIGSFELRNNENLSFFRLEEVTDSAYTIEFLDEDDIEIDAVQFQF